MKKFALNIIFITVFLMRFLTIILKVYSLINNISSKVNVKKLTIYFVFKNKTNLIQLFTARFRRQPDGLLTLILPPPAVMLPLAFALGGLLWPRPVVPRSAPPYMRIARSWRSCSPWD